MNMFEQINLSRVGIQNLVWRLEDGRLWSTAKAAFVDEAFAQEWLSWYPELTEVPSSPPDPENNPDNTKHGIPGLIYALKFYSLPMGELTPPEEAYDAEVRQVSDKYMKPWDGATGGILVSLQMTMTTAQIQGQDTTGIKAQYEKALQDMNAELTAIDEKYGV